MQCHSKKESGLGNTSIHIKRTQKLLSVDLRMSPSWEFLYPKTCYSRALKTSDKKEWRHLEMGNEVPREGTAGCWGKRPCWRPPAELGSLPESRREQWRHRESRAVRVSRENPEKNQLHREMTL